jgi:hypothetical protein
MRKLLLTVTALCTLLIGAGVASPAAAYPPGAVLELVLSREVGPPGFAFNAVIRGCFPGESVDFRLDNGAPVRAICSATTFQASVPFNGPPTPGPYAITATLLGVLPEGAENRPLVVTDSITVVAAPPDTTIAPTTVPGGITPPATTTTLGPGGRLPATGSSGIDGNLTIAGTLLAVGLGLLVVAGVRRNRRDAPAA